MIDKSIVSCGGVVICRGKALVLYHKNGRNSGWVLPKGKAEGEETFRDTAIREVAEESGAVARVVKSLGKTQYSFQRSNGSIKKTVHWFLMITNSYHCKPQAEEYFADGGFYKQHEAYHLLRYQDEKDILNRAFIEYTKRPGNTKRKERDNIV